jgi:hypothetical protein
VLLLGGLPQKQYKLGLIEDYYAADAQLDI